MRRARNGSYPLRQGLVLGALLVGLALLGTRAAYLQAWHADFLQTEGAARHLRLIKDNSHRGMILDRHGEPLAISTPVDSIWGHPPTLLAERNRIIPLAAALGITPNELVSELRANRKREFMYLKRHVSPEVARTITSLNLAGVGRLREYRRYYPAGAASGHVIGFTNVDDQGQEGVEFAYDPWLRAVPGTKRVIKDLQGNAVEVVESVTSPVPGKDLVLSLDRRVQYLASREIKAAVASHGARGGAAVVLDVATGEVLAMVNEPDFNPNNRAARRGQMFRNRAITDPFEPGSTLKPFTIAAALESGKFRPGTLIDTAPGYLQIGGHAIHDIHNYGTMTVERVLAKSSNIGMTKIGLALNKDKLWDLLRRMGFGATTGSRLPGESGGRVRPPSEWVPIEQASLSYGYGISVTPVQLARAYAVLANGGRRVPITIVRRDDAVSSEQVLSPAIASQVRHMLELAVSDDGTGAQARVLDYRIAGKTGTVRKLTPAGYADDQHMSWFAGFAPAAQPRLAMVVAIDSPTRGGYFGGEVAAPVFARVMSGALRLLDIPPDAPRVPVTHMAAVAAHGGE